jgi:predicted transcriptional regulator YdeE
MIMTTKDALKEIKNLFAKFNDEKFELTEGKLVDGTIVYYDLNTKEIYVAGADGEKVPAPVGEHELETGEIVIVTEEGKISEVKKKD